MNTKFSERLQEALDDKKWKPVDLVKRSKVDKSAISRYLSGNYKAKNENLTSMAEVLNVNETWLLGYDVPKQRTDPLLDTKDVILFNHISNLSSTETERELLTKCTMLEEEQQKGVLNMVNMILSKEDDKDLMKKDK